ncbi:MAG: glycosyltransferase family 2 protein [Rhizobiales bacterium]|nr:glycosyltransferase family 2 protein [Hyphomicrobiales bacterium]MBI3672933.1 glycosyltransferase family 2 protein [Hyphomicrobiales bacterium]
MAKPLPEVPLRDKARGLIYGGVFCLVRRHGRPVGIVEFSYDGEVISPSELATLIGSPPQPASPSSVAKTKTGPAPSITVVVATRDRAASLDRCLHSLMSQNYQNYDIVVVDNAPATSETADLIADRYKATGKVRYVREDRPGLGRAHNTGVSLVTAPYAAFTDDDVIVDPDWLAAIAANFSTDGKVGCVTGLILPAELETRAQMWTERHGGFGKGLERRLFDLGEHRPDNALFPFTAGQFGSGANMAFNMEALRRIGGFESALGAGTIARGGDDLASFYAVVKAGFGLVYEPEAIIWHHHRRDEEGMVRQAYGYGVGLGAYLTNVILDDPKTLWDLTKALPSGLAHMFGSSSPKNRRLPGDYPTALIWRERLGILAGVPSFVRSRRAVNLLERMRAPDAGNSAPRASSQLE